MRREYFGNGNECIYPIAKGATSIGSSFYRRLNGQMTSW
jgi:hypothetical protein